MLKAIVSLPKEYGARSIILKFSSLAHAYMMLDLHFKNMPFTIQTEEQNADKTKLHRREWQKCYNGVVFTDDNRSEAAADPVR